MENLATPELTQLMQDWVAAERTGDADTQARLMHTQFVAIGPLGFTLTKAQWLDRITAGDLNYDSLDLDELSVRQFNSTAIVIARQTQVAGFKDQQVKAQLRISATLIQDGAHWLIAGLQMSSIGRPPQFNAKPHQETK